MTVSSGGILERISTARKNLKQVDLRVRSDYLPNALLWLAADEMSSWWDHSRRENRADHDMD